MANCIPAGFESDDFSDDFDLSDDDSQNDFNEQPRKTKFHHNAKTYNSRSSGWSDFTQPAKQRSRTDMMNSTSPLDDFRNAVLQGNIEATKTFLQQGINVDHPFSSGWTALMYAANKSNTEMISLLIVHRANVNFNSDMYTVLMAACSSRCYDEQQVLKSVEILIDNKADVTAYDRHHVTSLMLASREGRNRVVDKLIQAGAPVNKQDNRGNTALMMACMYGHVLVVRTLLQHKADPNIHSVDGSTALEHASMNGHTKIEELLEAAGDSKKSKLILTEDDIRELGAVNKTDRDSLLGKNSENGIIRYGELEMLLSGLELGELIPLFHDHQVPFEDLLRMQDKDLVKMGVSRLGHRKKILDAIHQIHKKEWLPNSLTTMQYTKKVTSLETKNMLQNLKKHLCFISCTVGYIGDHIKADPAILLQAQEGTSALDLSAQTDEAMTNVRNLYVELSSLGNYLHKCAGDDNYQAADLIGPKKKRTKRRSAIKTFLITGAAIAVMGILVWKSDSIVQSVWKLK